MSTNERSELAQFQGNSDEKSNRRGAWIAAKVNSKIGKGSAILKR